MYTSDHYILNILQFCQFYVSNAGGKNPHYFLELQEIKVGKHWD